MSVITWVKEHPYETAGAVFAVGVVAIVVVNMGGSSSTTSSTDAADAAAIQAQEQASLQDAQISASEQQSSQAAQLQLDQYNLEAQVAALQSNNSLSGTVSTNQTAEDINAQNVQGSVANTTTEAAASVAEATTQANAQLQTALGADAASVQIAGVNATTQQLVSEYSNQALETEANDLAAANEAQSGASEAVGVANSSGVSGVLGLIGSVL